MKIPFEHLGNFVRISVSLRRRPYVSIRPFFLFGEVL